jgi:PIN domain
LPNHVAVEVYSVLTRMPGGLAVPAETAASIVTRRFNGAPLRLRAAESASLLETLAAASVFGGASYDGLVALEAKAHGCTMLTLDRRAQSTYRRLGVPFRMIAAAL